MVLSLYTKQAMGLDSSIDDEVSQNIILEIKSF